MLIPLYPVNLQVLSFHEEFPAPKRSPLVVKNGCIVVGDHGVRKPTVGFMSLLTLPETNESPLKNGAWKMKFPFGDGLFSGANC